LWRAWFGGVNYMLRERQRKGKRFARYCLFLFVGPEALTFHGALSAVIGGGVNSPPPTGFRD
jgi:hypothetical protein